MSAHSVLFVCKANLCRSPSAHGILRHKIAALGLQERIAVDSASTHDLYAGSPPDARSQEHAARRGYELSDLRARHIGATDFERADLILAMDQDNLRMLEALCPPQHRAKIRRLAEFCAVHTCDTVPDPYYGGHAQFEHVLDVLEDACEGLLRHLRQRL